MTAAVLHPRDPMLDNLAALRARSTPEAAPNGAPRVLFISLYCVKSFPVRIFHTLARKSGWESHALFFKDNFTNHHLPIADEEIALLRDLVSRIKPDLVGISVLAPYVPAARQVIAAVRAECCAPIIAGGKHPTIAPVEALSYADYACKGEGELALLEVFERLRAGKDLTDIPGLWHKDENGQAVDRGQRRLIEALDDIPFEAVGEPNMHFIEHKSYSAHDPELDEEEMLVMAGRGCVYMCSYCVNALLIPMNRGNGRFVRLRSPESVIAQVAERQKKQTKARFVSFNDEVFGVFDDWTADFSAKWRAFGGPAFNCELVPKLIKEHNIRELTAAGLYEMHFGIQSGSDEVRNEVLKRPGRNFELLEKAKMLDGLGVRVQCDLILGNPFDTAEVMAETIDLLRQMPRPLKLNTYKMQFFPHYPLTLRALKDGHIRETDLTEDKVANGTLYNFVYVPNVLRFDRKTVLENCVYLIPWGTPLVWRLAIRLAERHSLPLALLANAMAFLRYHLDFRQNRALIWARRVLVALKFVARGEWGALWRRLRAA